MGIITESEHLVRELEVFIKKLKEADSPVPGRGHDALRQTYLSFTESVPRVRASLKACIKGADTAEEEEEAENKKRRTKHIELLESIEEKFSEATKLMNRFCRLDE